VRTVTTFLAGHPERAGAVAVAFVVALSIAWYLGSPLFIRTYTNETLPAAPAATAAPVSTSGATNAPAAAARVLAQGELRYVDAVHNGKGPVLIIERTSTFTFHARAAASGPSQRAFTSAR